jgi:hypothetical protein
MKNTLKVLKNRYLSSVLFIAVLVIMIAGISGFPAKAEYFYYYDFNYDGRIPLLKETSNIAADWMDGEYYDDQLIQSYVFANNTELFITAFSLGHAKTFTMMSHGGHDGDDQDKNYLVTYYDEAIYPNEIPDLSEVHGGGPQLLGVGFACYSGTDHVSNPRLWKGFINEGSEAYIGFNDEINTTEVYYFSYYFYQAASLHYTVEESIAIALYYTDYDLVDRIELWGDGDIYLVDD